jgi:serine/threonine protein kinase
MKRYEWHEILIERRGSLLGHGNLAFVLKGKWKRFNDKIVAVKIVTESICETKNISYEKERENLLKEGDILYQANLKGISNIISVFGIVEGILPDELVSQMPCPAGENEQAVGLVLEYMQGTTLSLFLYPKASIPKIPLTTSDKLHIICESATALSEMHAAGIIHGDIKPQNVLISTHSPPLIKLIDFGLSTLRETSVNLAFGVSTIRDTVTLKGTLHYCAPEMLNALNGFKTSVIASRSTDMYAFAVYAWEILSRTTPFERDTNFPQCVLDGQRPSRSLLPSDTPKMVVEMLLDCWDVDRSKRKSAIECLSILSTECELLKGGEFDIFFSHASKNKPFLSHVHRLLVRNGYRVWYDITEMGHDLEECMIDGIEHSKVILVCLNSHYATRESCLFELREAKKRNKIIIALLIEPGIEMIVNEATELCQIGKKRYVDIGTVATKVEWEMLDSIPNSLTAELLVSMEPLLDLMRKVDCLPTLWQQEDEENKLLAEFSDAKWVSGGCLSFLNILLFSSPLSLYRFNGQS